MNEKIHYIVKEVSILFKEQGIKSVTMDVISEVLNISKRTLYYYFRNKEHIIGKFIDYHIYCSSNNIKIVTSKGNAIEKLFELSKTFENFILSMPELVLNDLANYYPFMLDKYKEKRQEKIFEHILENINEGVDQGLYRIDLKKELTARFYTYTFDSIFDNKKVTINNIKSDDYFRHIFTYFIRGMATYKGLEYIDNLEKNNNTLKQ